ncbi:MAG: UDP-glucose/GDP-mannose dehydrogenase family protein, partial [Deltaproteobacteria bacterium]|nr:UDP-glucose/GDP-mannose dehydrogenase family protein [Deltaproteobacteria bacterium]
MKIAIIGAGYVGLVSAACFAELGHTVICLDADAAKIGLLADGTIPLYEPGLAELVKQNLRRARLRFTTAWPEAVGGADVVFIAVGTPTSRRGNGYADMSYVYEAARSLAPHFATYTVVVNKSTVPVGTARHVAAVIREANPAAEYDVASNPEFLREGDAVRDFMHPDRVVCGVQTARARAVLEAVYRPLAANGATVL